MPGRIERIFSALRSEGKRALMPFVTAGHPAPDATAAAITGMHAAGAAIVEVGIPFSDPVADGPVIAASMHRALQSGVTPAGALSMVAQARSSSEGGIVAMVSWSIVWRIGPKAFIAQAAAQGLDGLILPDMDLSEAEAVAGECDERGLSLSLLVAPGTSDARAQRIVRCCRGFVYLLARVGLTGERDAAPEVASSVARIRSMTDLPICAGFGISTAEHVRAVTAEADGAIVGSALVRRMDSSPEPVAAAVDFTRELARGLCAGRAHTPSARA